MLNHFKIPTKLMGGFSIILLLLFLVAAGAYWGIQSVDACLQEVVATEDIQTNMMTLRRELLQAQIAAFNGLYHRNTDFEAVRAGHDKEIHRIANLIRNELREANQSDLEKFEGFYRSYCEWDKKWYEKETVRAVAADQLVTAAGNAITTLDECRATFAGSMSAPLGTDNRFGFIEEDERKYYLSRRVDQLAKIDHFKFQMQTLCQEYFALFSTTEISKRLNILESIVTIRKEFARNTKDFHDDMTTETSRNVIKKVMEAFQAWETNFDIAVGAMKDQDSYIFEQDKDVVEMEKLMTAIIERLDDRVGEIRVYAGNVKLGIISSLAVVSGLALLFGFFTSVCLSRNITVGLKRTLDTVRKIVCEGDLSLDIDDDLLRRRDEIGELANVSEMVAVDYHRIGEMAVKLAEGDWRVEVREKGPLDVMNQSLKKMIVQVNAALHEIHGNVSEVQKGAVEVNVAAETLSSGAQSSSSSLEEITASMTEISSQTTANAESAKEANVLATGASKAATEGQQAMRDMNEAMDRITKNSTQIQRVIKVIDDIAFQTNLLALNAAVEAARAGVHGKGFAVVAEEVRNLAARSAKAAQETTDLISTSGREIEQGAAVSAKTAEVLNAIVDQIKQTTEFIGNIAVATNEQAQGVAQISIGLQQIDAVTQQNTAAAEECASASSEMNGMASGLQALVAKFQLQSS